LRRPARGPAMDTFFLSHGSPTLSIDEAIPARHFFKSWLPARVAGDRPPRAILVVSGHWETATPAVNVIRGTNDTIHDFYGFPKPMYQEEVKIGSSHTRVQRPMTLDYTILAVHCCIP